MGQAQHGFANHLALNACSISLSYKKWVPRGEECPLKTLLQPYLSKRHIRPNFRLLLLRRSKTLKQACKKPS